MQRVEGGRLRGRRLMAAPRGVPGLRPTAARVRAAIYDRLQTEIEHARVLDLFAGSGALAIEALSRGARDAVLIERDRKVVRFLRQQLSALGLEGVARVVAGDCHDVLRQGPGRVGGPFDLVLVDPPFAQDGVFEPIAGLLLSEGWLAPDAAVVCERERIRGKSPTMHWPAGLTEESSRVYGQATVEVLRRTQQEHHG